MTKADVHLLCYAVGLISDLTEESIQDIIDCLSGRIISEEDCSIISSYHRGNTTLSIDIIDKVEE